MICTKQNGVQYLRYIQSDYHTGTIADYTQVYVLIDGFTVKYILADRAYDTNEVTGKAGDNHINVAIPPQK